MSTFTITASPKTAMPPPDPTAALSEMIASLTCSVAPAFTGKAAAVAVRRIGVHRGPGQKQRRVADQVDAAAVACLATGDHQPVDHCIRARNQ